ncbi:hypothetical protein VM1G_06472 [Cytospora mali]|uniref:Protein kinase domain-containing protein n=1 Tax=Cytospora mali TaxID=578113 RepID=A0A194W452_CYTMA|nr:hypothetical protein VM1G_06472 [Valsa mali]
MDSPSSRQRLDDYMASCAAIGLDDITNKIDTAPATTTRGPITDPEGRLAPTTLAPWVGACDVLDEIFRNLRVLEATDHDSSPRFPSRGHVDDTGYELSVIDSETAVHYFDIDTVFKPAKRILDFALSRPGPLRTSLSAILHSRRYSTSAITDRPGQVVFSPHSKTVTSPARLIARKRGRQEYTDDHENDDIESEIQVSVDKDGSGPALDVNRAGNNARINVKSGPGNYYCSFVFSTSSSKQQSRLLMIAEAKAPHNLTRRLIQSALGDDHSTTLDLRQFIHSTEPEQPDLPRPPAQLSAGSDIRSSDYNDQKCLAAVATQIYTTLLDQKLRYGYITTGESYILVRIRPGQATTLEYLLLPVLSEQPSRDGEWEATWLNWLAATPLSRLCCLALLSLFGDGQLTDAEVAQAEATRPAMIWNTPQHKDISVDVPTRAMNDTGESLMEAKRPRVSTLPTAQDPYQLPPCRTPPLDTQQHETQQCENQQSEVAQTRFDMDTAPFCTLRCLSSLKATGDVNAIESADPACPNRAVHTAYQQHSQRQSVHETEPASSETEHISARLRGLARHIELPLHRQETLNEYPPALLRESTENATYIGYGASSAVFKVRLEGGYVLVAKAGRSNTVMGSTFQRLRGENRIYEKLHALQGDGVPVCLGLVDLSKGNPHFHPDAQNPGYVHFTGYLLLSWAGKSVCCWEGSSPYCTITARDIDIDQERVRHQTLRAGVERLLGKMHELGVLHGDTETRNIATTSNDSLTILDFERATTKGSFCRRLARKYKGVGNGDLDYSFRYACETEMKKCLDSLDNWAKGRVRRLEEHSLRIAPRKL